MTQATPIYPPGRYGRRREPGGRRRRLAMVLGLALVVAAGLVVAWRLYNQYGSGYDASVLSVTVNSDSQVTIRFSVHEPDPAGALCRVQAQDYTHAEVGYAQVVVPAGRDVTTTYTLSTTARAYSADVLGCGPAQPN